MNLSGVPHLTTALTGPLLKIESHLLDRQAKIEAWLRSQFHRTPPPFYSSVDLRNSGFKLAPVDTNLFPAGYNNLNPAFLPLCIQAVQAAVERICPDAARLLVIPENHTRNTFYLEAFATLIDIIRRAGFEVRIGSLLPDLAEPKEIALPSGRTLLLEPLQREGDALRVGDYYPCAVILNNDLSKDAPAILQGLKCPVVPPVALGWHKRLKSEHFAQYRRVAFEFAELIDLDPWFIDPLFRKCGEINFMRREGEECVATNTEALLADIQRKYDEYGVDREPFVIVKADAGTYGMGIMTVRHPEEIYTLNRKQRSSMAASKEGQTITKVILQEGVYSFETFGPDHGVAEPVVYMIDRYVVGGFYRLHTERGPDENLNAPGMKFEPLSFADPCNNPDQQQPPDAGPNRFYAYGVVARLASLAAAREVAAVKA